MPWPGRGVIRQRDHPPFKIETTHTLVVLPFSRLRRRWHCCLKCMRLGDIELSKWHLTSPTFILGRRACENLTSGASRSPLLPGKLSLAGLAIKLSSVPHHHTTHCRSHSSCVTATHATRDTQKAHSIAQHGPHRRPPPRPRMGLRLDRRRHRHRRRRFHTLAPPLQPPASQEAPRRAAHHPLRHSLCRPPPRHGPLWRSLRQEHRVCPPPPTNHNPSNPPPPPVASATPPSQSSPSPSPSPASTSSPPPRSPPPSNARPKPSPSPPSSPTSPAASSASARSPPPSSPRTSTPCPAHPRASWPTSTT